MLGPWPHGDVLGNEASGFCSGVAAGEDRCAFFGMERGRCGFLSLRPSIEGGPATRWPGLPNHSCHPFLTALLPYCLTALLPYCQPCHTATPYCHRATWPRDSRAVRGPTPELLVQRRQAGNGIRATCLSETGCAMSRCGRRKVLVGLVAIAACGVAYPIAYFGAVPKQFAISTSTTRVSRPPLGHTWSIQLWNGPPGRSPKVTLRATPYSPGLFFLKPRYTSIMGWPDNHPMEMVLAHVFHPLHEVDRRWIRVRDWDSASEFGGLPAARRSWLSVTLAQ
jgi:hypothetical protein